MWTIVLKVVYTALMLLLFIWANTTAIGSFNKNLGQLHMDSMNNMVSPTVKLFRTLSTSLSFVIALTVLGFSSVLLWRYVLSSYAMEAFQMLESGGVVE